MSDPYQDLADRLKRKDLETSNQFLVAENATLRASLKEAQERVGELEKAMTRIANGEEECPMLAPHFYGHGIAIAKAALSPKPQEGDDV